MVQPFPCLVTGHDPGEEFFHLPFRGRERNFHLEHLGQIIQRLFFFNTHFVVAFDNKLIHHRLVDADHKNQLFDVEVELQRLQHLECDVRHATVKIVDEDH